MRLVDSADPSAGSSVPPSIRLDDLLAATGARLLGPTVRLVAQMRLEARSEEEQRRALLESEGEGEGLPLSDAVGRLLALIASGTA